MKNAKRLNKFRMKNRSLKEKLNNMPKMVRIEIAALKHIFFFSLTQKTKQKKTNNFIA